MRYARFQFSSIASPLREGTGRAIPAADLSPIPSTLAVRKLQAHLQIPDPQGCRLKLLRLVREAALDAWTEFAENP